MSDETVKPMVGVFSNRAATLYGIVEYRDAAGNVIPVTAVYPSVEEAKKRYLWEDMQIVSTTLTAYVGKLHGGQSSYLDKHYKKTVDIPPSSL